MKDDTIVYELTIDKHGIRFRRTNPNPLTANQKCGIVMAVIGMVSVLGFFWLMTGH